MPTTEARQRERYESAIEKRDTYYAQDIQHLDIKSDQKHYPERVDFRPGSRTHDRVLTLLNEYKRAARAGMQPIYQEWRALDWLYEGYMPADMWDQGVAERDPRKPVTITVGSAFAMRNVYRAFMSRAFTTPYGIYRYRGMGGRARQARAAVAERVHQRQAYWFKHKRALDIMFANTFTYGRAPVALDWAKRFGMVSKNEVVSPLLSMQLAMRGILLPPGTEVAMPPEEGIVAEGTKLQPLDIYQCLFDPDAAPDSFQEAAFFGYQYKTNARRLKERAYDDEERLFNCSAVEIRAHQNGLRSKYWNDSTGRGARTGMDQVDYWPTTDRHDLHITRMFLRIVPADLGLGSSERPEWWVFSDAGDEVLIEGRPLEHWHRQLPVVDAAPNADLCPWPVSHQLATSKLNLFKNWLMKSTADAVMTILVGRIFVNQRYVNMEDMKRPLMGKLVRVSHSEYDTRGVRDFVHQLDTQDPTAAHMAKLMELDQLDRNISGVGDLTMGIMGQMPERPGVAGVNAATMGMFGRMEHDAGVIDEQAIQVIGHQMLYNTRQWMDMDMRLSILGRYPELVRQQYGLEEGEDEFSATAFDIDPDFAVVPYSGALNKGRNPQQMVELMKTLISVEGVGQMLAQEDTVKRLFWATWRELGAQEEEEWETSYQVNVMDDQVMEQEIQAGNLVGADQMGMGAPL